MKEYRKFWEMDDSKPTFAGSDEQFDIGDVVQCNGMEYSVDSFWRSPYARPNEVDWLRLRRLNGTTWIWCDAYPSEVQLFAREVLTAYENPTKSKEIG